MSSAGGGGQTGRLQENPAAGACGAEQLDLRPTLGHRCLQDVESMNNSRFVLNRKQQIFSVSEDCLVLNIYSPAEAPAGAGRPVGTPEGPVHLIQLPYAHLSPPRPCFQSTLEVLRLPWAGRWAAKVSGAWGSVPHGHLCRSWYGSMEVL